MGRYELLYFFWLLTDHVTKVFSAMRAFGVGGGRVISFLVFLLSATPFGVTVVGVDP